MLCFIHTYIKKEDYIKLNCFPLCNGIEIQADNFSTAFRDNSKVARCALHEKTILGKWLNGHSVQNEAEMIPISKHNKQNNLAF